MSSFSDEFINSELAHLVETLSATGGFVDEKVEFKGTKDRGMGVYVNAPVEPKTILIRVPFHMCISVDLIVSSPRLSVVFQDNPGLLSYPDEVLAIGLVYAALNPSDNSCVWLKHTQTLPKTFNSTVFWSEDELLELKDCMAYHITNMMKKQIAYDYESIYLPLTQNYPFLEGLTVELYQWALSVVYSRAIEICKEGQAIRCIPPVLDMANHNPTNTDITAIDTFNYDETKDEIQLVATLPLQAGEECFAIYGEYPNSKLLMVN